jgi:hypothetical protein
MNIGPLIRLPEELVYPRPVRDDLAVEATRAQLLELRTESGTLYLCPSGWQRIRLLWIFRHFHVLSSQVLSRRNQRLIVRLSRTALVKPPLPVARDRVFGVVEKQRTKPTESRSATKRTVQVRPSLQVKPDIRDWPGPGLPDHRTLASEDPGPGSTPIQKAVAKMYGVRDEGFQQWGALGMLSAVCVVVILGRIYGGSLPAKAAHFRTPPALSAPMEQAAIRVSLPTVPLPSVENPKQRLTPLKPEPEPTLIARKSAPPRGGLAGSKIDSSSAAAPFESAPTAPSGASERLFVSELPQGHFVEPVVSDPNLVGELHLRALIGADGSVKEVTVVSGNPKLAEAGMRAVRRWHYSPYQAPGLSGEGETLIRMRFFGQDTVSITSIAR